MALPKKQLLFVNEYLIDKNATRAAKAAGYSARSAHTEGHRLLKKAEIAALVEKGLEEQRASSEQRAAEKGFTKERWLEELQRVALSNVDDFIRIEKVKSSSSGRTYLTAVPIATKDRKTELGAAVRKISETKNGIGIELHNKIAALDILGKAYGWVKTEIEIPPGTVNVNLTMPSNGREAKDGKD